MYTLPRLATSQSVTPAGDYRLPLAEATAERLTDALLARDPAARQAAFRAAVEGDPALAVWGLALAHARGLDSLSTAPKLSDWLATLPPTDFLPEQGDEVSEPEVAPLAEFAEPAGCSLAVGELAAKFARDRGADIEHAFFLGLVHLGAAWLSESFAGDAPPRLPGVALPEWLIDASLRVSLAPHEQSPETLCVSQAMATVCEHNPDAWHEVGCDSHYWVGRWTMLGETWGQPGPWCERFARIVERLATIENLEQGFAAAVEQARLEALKELAYGAGHEINNPLANISARAQTLLSGEQDPERRRTLAAINTQAFRAHEMIADMMLFARPPVPHKQAFDLAAIAGKLVEELAEQAADQQSQLVLRAADGPLPVVADATQIAVAIRSLCVNALESLVQGGRVELELLDAADEPDVRILVRDTGPGIPAELRAKIFDPFFSGREAGRGLGLGLSKCWRIVTQHGGRIDVESPVKFPGNSAAGQGAQFTISLPRGDAR